MRRNLYNFRQLKKRVFLEAYRQNGNITQSCEVAGVCRDTYYYWQEHDERFSMACKQAEIEATDALEQEARRRAVEGVTREKGVYYLGEKLATETVTEYSDTLLIFLLKGLRPDKYRERVSVDQTQPLVKVYEGVPWDEV